MLLRQAAGEGRRKEGRIRTSPPERGCVADQPQQRQSMEVVVSPGAVRSANVLRLVCDTAALRPRRTPGQCAIEHHAILLALRKHHFNRTATAKNLGISRHALLYKLQPLRAAGWPVE